MNTPRRFAVAALAVVALAAAVALLARGHLVGLAGFAALLCVALCTRPRRRAPTPPRRLDGRTPLPDPPAYFPAGAPVREGRGEGVGPWTV